MQHLVGRPVILKLFTFLQWLLLFIPHFATFAFGVDVRSIDLHLPFFALTLSFTTSHLTVVRAVAIFPIVVATAHSKFIFVRVFGLHHLFVLPLVLFRVLELQVSFDALFLFLVLRIEAFAFALGAHRIAFLRLDNLALLGISCRVYLHCLVFFVRYILLSVLLLERIARPLEVVLLALVVCSLHFLVRGMSNN